MVSERLIEYYKASGLSDVEAQYLIDDCEPCNHNWLTPDQCPCGWNEEYSWCRCQKQRDAYEEVTEGKCWEVRRWF